MRGGFVHRAGGVAVSLFEKQNHGQSDVYQLHGTTSENQEIRTAVLVAFTQFLMVLAASHREVNINFIYLLIIHSNFTNNISYYLKLDYRGI